MTVAKSETDIRRDIVAALKFGWDRGHINTTGVSISERLSDTEFVCDQSGTGFRRCQISEDDLLVINNDCDLVRDAPNGSLRRAPVNTIVHAAYYKKNKLARACIHCHAPYTSIFACEGLTIHPYTLQSYLLGDIECIIVDDTKLKKDFHSIGTELAVPTGLHSRPDVYYVMREVAEQTANILSHRSEEMKSHGLAVTHYQHGIFVFARDIWEAYDNLERAEANARSILFSKLLK